MLFFNTVIRLRSPSLPTAAIGVTLVDGLYRYDTAKLPYLLVVPIAPASASAFHRGQAAIDDALCPFLSAAYNLLDVLYLAVLTYLIVMTNTVATAVTFGIAAVNFADYPLLFPPAVFKNGICNFAKGFKLIVMSGAVSAYETLLTALGVAALNLAPFPCPMKAMVLARGKYDEIFRIIVVMVAVFVVDVQQFARFAFALWNRAVGVNVSDLMRFKGMATALRVCIGRVQVKRIAVSLPAPPMGRTPPAAKGGRITPIDTTADTLIFPCSFSWHGMSNVLCF